VYLWFSSAEAAIIPFGQSVSDRIENAGRNERLPL
jgi:hypothetical protein